MQGLAKDPRIHYYILIQTCLFPAIYHISVAQSRMTEADNGCRARDGAHVKGCRSQASPVVGEDLEFLILLPQALGKELWGPSCPGTPSFQDETLQNHSSHPLLPFFAFSPAYILPANGNTHGLSCPVPLLFPTPHSLARTELGKDRADYVRSCLCGARTEQVG